MENVAPEEPATDGPKQEPQIQLQEVARAKAEAKRKAKLEGQGDLFAMFAPASEVEETQPEESIEETTIDDIEGPRNASNTPHDYQIVHTAEELQSLCDQLSKFSEFCFDTETTGVNPVSSHIVGISFAVEPHKAWYVPFNLSNREAYVKILRPLMENKYIAKIGQNIKFDIMVLRRLGIEVRGRKIDTMLLHYLIDAESRHNMNFLAERYLNYTPIAIETLIGKGAKQLTMDLVGIDRIAEYAAEDADITL